MNHIEEGANPLVFRLPQSTAQPAVNPASRLFFVSFHSIKSENFC